MECLLVEYLQMKVKENPDCTRTPYILLIIVFPIDMFYGFSLPGNFLFKSWPLAKIDICTNSSLISSFLLEFSRKTVFEGNCE